MNKKRLGLFWIILLMLIVVFEQNYCLVKDIYADNLAEVAEVKNSEDGIVLYIRGAGGEVESAEAVIGNVSCPKVKASKLGSENVPLRTLILLDNSISIPEKSRGEINSFLLNLIAGKMGGEQFAVGTFSENANVICDYTDNYDSLKSAIEGIQYADQETYLTDVLYEVLENNFSESEEIYERILVISDGVDNKAIGYTSDELSKLIEKKRIPIYSLGVYNSKKSNDENLKNMFALSRQSRAASAILDDNNGPTDLTAAMGVDKDIIKAVITPEADVKDGGEKTVSVTLHTGGVEVTVTENNVKMPQEAGKKKDEPKPEPEPKPEQKPEPKPDPEPEPSFIEKNLLFIIIGVVVLLAVIVGIIVTRLLKKKESPLDQVYNPYQPDLDKTEDLRSFSGDRTEILGNTDGSAVLVLTDINTPVRTFEAPLRDRVLIGRPRKDGSRTADICIDEKSVSHEHCEIQLRGNTLFVRDHNSTNGTFVKSGNDYEPVNPGQEMPIMSGDIIKLGRLELSVTLRADIYSDTDETMRF